MQGSEEPSYSITSSAMASMVWQVANSLSHVASPMKYAASNGSADGRKLQKLQSR